MTEKLPSQPVMLTKWAPPAKKNEAKLFAIAFGDGAVNFISPPVLTAE